VVASKSRGVNVVVTQPVFLGAFADTSFSKRFCATLQFADNGGAYYRAHEIDSHHPVTSF
jgi:hypothetical protein